MYIDVLYRIRAAPVAHLGRRSLTLLDAFHTGYGYFPQIAVPEALVTDAFRNLVVTRYRPSDAATKDEIQILLDIAEDDACAFDLFFETLDVVLPEPPHFSEPRALRQGEPLPASGYLDVLIERPGMFLRFVNVGSLRAFLDGYSLAALECGRPDCADLEGFEHWVRHQLGLKGYFRWESPIRALFRGDEAAAFQWAQRELKAYRSSKGPISTRRFEVHLANDV